jgi:hypothetical protein
VINRTTKLITSAALLLIGILLDTSLTVSAQPQIQPYICASNNTDVNIRDARTLQTVGKLNYGECLESHNWYYKAGEPTLRMRVINQESYFIVVGGKSGQLRLVSARYVNIVWK